MISSVAGGLLIACAFVFSTVGTAQKPHKGTAKPIVTKPPTQKTVQKSAIPSLSSYIPLKAGAEWKYHVEFPDNADLLYYPEFDRPEGLVSASLFSGSGEWKKGAFDFDIAVNDILFSSPDSVLANVTPSDSAHRFFFYFVRKDSSKGTALHQFRSKSIAGKIALDFLFIFGAGDPPAFQLAKPLAKLTSADQNEKYDITVPAGTFKNCIKSVVAIETQGVVFGAQKQTFESYLAPNVGIVKAVGKTSDGKLLYTLELTQFSPGKQ
jgi:hypothetical protein